jgi:hypothetical protein
MQFTAATTGGGTLVWSVNGIAGGDATVGTVDTAGNYTAPAISHSINAVVQAAASAAPQSNFATAIVALIQPGQVQATANPQVALYSVNLPQPGTVTVQFGADTVYGMRTWAQPTPSSPVNDGGQVNIQVAGMRVDQLPHASADHVGNGVTYKDSDTCSDGHSATSSLQITTPSGCTSQDSVVRYHFVRPDTLQPQSGTGVRNGPTRQCHLDIQLRVRPSMS